jgi:hypothetical protein
MTPPTPATEGTFLRMVRPEKIPVRSRCFQGTYLVLTREEGR